MGIGTKNYLTHTIRFIHVNIVKTKHEIYILKTLSIKIVNKINYASNPG